MLLPNQLHSSPQQCAWHHPRGPGGGPADHPHLHYPLHPPLHTHAGGEAILHTQVRIHCVGQTTLHQGKLSGCTICAQRRFEEEKGGGGVCYPQSRFLLVKLGNPCLHYSCSARLVHADPLSAVGMQCETRMLFSALSPSGGTPWLIVQASKAGCFICISSSCRGLPPRCHATSLVSHLACTQRGAACPCCSWPATHRPHINTAGDIQKSFNMLKCSSIKCSS